MYTTGSSRTKYETTAPLNAHDRLKRMHEIRHAFKRDRIPLPQGKTELDILKERNKFIRDQQQRDGEAEELSWEDKLAQKYYDSLFREFAVANLKHYKTGQIGLRWRTEDEVIAGIAHLTCASMRCEFHEPPEDAEVDPDSNEPLVPTSLEEFQVPFAYVEDGERKSALVKLMLCHKCGKKLLYSHKVKKEMRGELVPAEAGPSGGRNREREGERKKERRRSASPEARP